MKFLFVLFAFLLAQPSFARGLTAAEKLQDFQQLQSLIMAEYGPLELKKAANIIDMEKLGAEFSPRVQATATNQEFYTAIMEYVARFQDGHFGVLNDTERLAVLPLSVDLIGGKVLITYINRSALPETKFNFSVGDELLAVDGQPVSSVLDSLVKVINSGNPKSARRKAAWSITTRSGMRFPIPANKQAVLKIRRGISDLIEEAALDWNVTGTVTDENDLAKFLAKPVAAKMHYWDALDQDTKEFSNPMADRRYACNPGTRVAVPANATMVMTEPFVAYTYPTAKGQVGYVRFPHYYPTDANGEITNKSVQLWYEKARFVLSIMEKSTVGLIIDQDHNCGGSVKLVEDMIGLFLTEKAIPQPFKLRANKASYLDLKKEMDGEPNDTLEYMYYKRLMDLVETTWRNTNDFMTALTPITGREWIYPDPEVHYTKPVVILIDEMAGSGGDAFPSMMKGIGRAKLFGQQTMGLGGSVNEFPALFHSRMTIRMTVTLFFKPDGSPVENNGAVPDRFYETTREDVMYEYKPYQQAYTAYLLEQL